jgi:hypothetical protein
VIIRRRPESQPTVAFAVTHGRLVLASNFTKIYPVLQGKKHAHATNCVDENAVAENGDSRPRPGSKTSLVNYSDESTRGNELYLSSSSVARSALLRRADPEAWAISFDTIVRLGRATRQEGRHGDLPESGSGAGDGNRIASQISNPHRTKALPTTLKVNCCQMSPNRSKVPRERQVGPDKALTFTRQVGLKRPAFRHSY